MQSGERIPFESLDTSYASEARANDNDTPAMSAPAFEIIVAGDSLLDEFAAESVSSEEDRVVDARPPLVPDPAGAVAPHTDAANRQRRQFGRRNFLAAVATLAVGIGLHTLLPDSPAPPAPSPSAPRPLDAAPAPAARIAETPTLPVIPQLTVQDQPRQMPESPALDPVARPGRGAVTSAKPRPLQSEPAKEEEEDEVAALLAVSSPIETAATEAVAPAPVPNAEEIAEVRHEVEIRGVLDAYRDSYERLDAVSAARLWPGVDTAALSKAFSTLSMQEVEFDSCNLGVSGQYATANCNGSLRYVRKVGSASPQSRALAWTFELERSSGRWLITRVTAK